MSRARLIQFHSQPKSSVIRFKVGAGLTGVVDRQNCVIRGVSVITGGVEAEGHSLFCDDTLLTRIVPVARDLIKNDDDRTLFEAGETDDNRLTVCGLVYLRQLDGSNDPVKAGYTGL